MQEKIFAKLSMARRAGMLCYGFESVKETVVSGKSEIIFLATDISRKTKKEVEFFAKDRAKVIYTDSTQEDFANKLGIKTGIISLKDRGFEEAVKRIMEAE